MLRSELLTGLTGIALLITGCSGQEDDRPDLASVSGFVTVDGAAVPGLKVTFRPEKGRTSSGITDDSGTYTLQYLRDVSGAVIGKHTVSINHSLGLGGDASDPAATRVEPVQIPKQYNSETTLTAEVVEGENVFVFELESSP